MLVAAGDIEVYLGQLAAADPDRLADIMRAEHVRVAVDLACGAGKAIV